MCLQVWKLGWSPRPGGELGTALPEIPVEFLQEKDVFREFLYRINTLGKGVGSVEACSAQRPCLSDHVVMTLAVDLNLVISR